MRFIQRYIPWLLLSILFIHVARGLLLAHMAGNSNLNSAIGWGTDWLTMVISNFANIALLGMVVTYALMMRKGQNSHKFLSLAHLLLATVWVFYLPSVLVFAAMVGVFIANVLHMSTQISGPTSHIDPE